MDEHQQQLFIDAEYCIDKYFDDHLKPRLDYYLEDRERARISEMSRGFGLRNAVLPTYDYAKNVTLNFPAKDIENVCKELDGNHHDIDILAEAWKEAAIEKLGQPRYDELSTALGGDLAKAYVGHRLMMKMVDYEVEKNPIKDSADYILDEARRTSISGYLGPSSDLQKLIDKKVVEKYDPSLLEKGAGKALGALSDTVITAPVLGVTSWAGFANVVAGDVILQSIGENIDNIVSEQSDVGKLVSSAVFDGDREALSVLCSQTSSVNPRSSRLVNVVNDNLSKKLFLLSSPKSSTPLSDAFMTQPKIGFDVSFTTSETPDYAGQFRQQVAIGDKFGKMGIGGNSDSQSDSEESTGQKKTVLNSKAIGGWGQLLDQLGLSGFGTVGKNFGYVLAMLPDILIGMFTGKSRNLKFGDNLLPIGAIIAGMFVKNPFLKLLLIGLGGANLLNKAGHEVLENNNNHRQTPIQYRRYPDETLNSRIQQPVIKGNSLVCDIDHIPYTISLNDEVVDAYEKGHLPLNTLVNAVLRKYDEQKALMEENYARQESLEVTQERSMGLK